jgi:hypothetical protein
MKDPLSSWIGAPTLALLASLGIAAAQEPLADQTPARTIDGYKGIWFDLGQKSEFGSKYSGGLGTYTAKHHPLAVYAPAARKTFFVYGGTTRADARHLLAMVSYYDHRTKRVPKPVVVHDKQGVDDPHDNPSIQIDGAGHLWVFTTAMCAAPSTRTRNSTGSGPTATPTPCRSPACISRIDPEKRCGACPTTWKARHPNQSPLIQRSDLQSRATSPPGGFPS